MLMNAMLAHRGVPYFHFLQPNQDYSQRRFSRRRSRGGAHRESPFKRSVEGGYPVLETEMQSNDVKDAHLHLTNATRIFDTAPSPVYIDNCCHYTLPGNQILADFIAATILNSEGPWK